MTTTAIPRTARTLAALDPVALTDASLLLARTGSTDGRATLAALRLALVGPEVSGCIGAADVSVTLPVAGADQWTPVAIATTTNAPALRGGTHDDLGGFTLTATGGRETGGASLLRLSYRLFVGAGSQPTLDGAILIDGVPQPGSQSPGRVAPASGGVLLVGECLRVVAPGEIVQVGVKRRTGTADLTVFHLSLTLHRL